MLDRKEVEEVVVAIDGRTQAPAERERDGQYIHYGCTVGHIPNRIAVLGGMNGVAKRKRAVSTAATEAVPSPRRNVDATTI